MEKLLTFDTSHLAHDLIGPLRSMEGLVNISMYPNSKEEAREICIRFQQLTKTIDERIARELLDIAKGEDLN